MDRNGSCFYWDDYVELHESSVSISLLVFCIAILAVDILLMTLIITTEELRKQVRKISLYFYKLFRE